MFWGRTWKSRREKAERAIATAALAGWQMVPTERAALGNNTYYTLTDPTGVSGHGSFASREIAAYYALKVMALEANLEDLPWR